MSILLSSDAGWLIDQENFINLNIKSIKCDGISKSFIVNPSLFNINSQFLRPNQQEQSEDNIKPKKRKLSCKTFIDTCNLNETILLVQLKLVEIIKQARQLGYISTFHGSAKDENKSAKLFSNEFYKETSSIDFAKYSKGGNNSSDNLLVILNDEKFIIPANCNFYSYDIREMKNHLDFSIQYDLIALDPPWWNKHIRRKKSQGLGLSYNMLENSELLNLPIKKLLKHNGIVLIWCTNSPSHLTYINDVLFPEWNLTKEAIWYWVKITKDGKPICDFSKPPVKQPFEQIIIGRFNAGNIINDDCDFKIIPDQKIIVSVPSALHSHKPNLTEILTQFLPDTPMCLELFARSLQRNWTSYGFEPLRLQHISLFKQEAD